MGGVSVTSTPYQTMAVESRSYNIFGKARTSTGGLDPDGTEGSGLIYPTEGLTQRTTRGFTGHEHLQQNGLIHMNGRIYDPEIGRFMSADPFISMPNHSQSINPFSYVMNNPLKYTDPSGYMIYSDPFLSGDRFHPGDAFEYEYGLRMYKNFLFEQRKARAQTVRLASDSKPTTNSLTANVSTWFDSAYSSYVDNVGGFTYFLLHHSDQISDQGGFAGAFWDFFGQDAIDTINSARAGNYELAFVHATTTLAKPIKLLKSAGHVVGRASDTLNRLNGAAKNALNKMSNWFKRKKDKAGVNCTKGGGPSCFFAGTQVLTDKGYVDIEKIEVGDKVWAYNEETGESDWKTVTHTWIVHDKQIYQLIITNEQDGQQTIEATATHPFYVVDKGWVETIDLVAGDTLVDKDNGFLTVKSVTDQNCTDTAHTEN